MKHLKQALSYRGRSGRGTYWTTNILLNLVAIALTLASRLAPEVGVVQACILLATILWYIVVIWIGTAVMVRRGHDRGRPALWSLLVFATASAGFIALGIFPNPIVVLILAVTVLYQIIDYAFSPGDPKVNRYGSSHSGSVTKEPLVLA
jgi:uncharacterized membrane protein YhaH (DUF805 family)